jgi:hypothetical protein
MNKYSGAHVKQCKGKHCSYAMVVCVSLCKINLEYIIHTYSSVVTQINSFVAFKLQMSNLFHVFLIFCLLVFCVYLSSRNTFLYSNGAIEAKRGSPPIMPAVVTPGGLLDLSSVLFRNRIIFIGQPVNSKVARRVISQLLTLATIDEDADILVWLYFYLGIFFFHLCNL